MKFKKLSTLTAASIMLVVLAFVATSFGQPTKVGLCHANADGKFSFISIPPTALDAHYDRDLQKFLNGHDLDFFADSQEECDQGTGGGGEEPPGAVPEPLTILLFGAGVAGVGYATRRLRRKSDKDSGELE